MKFCKKLKDHYLGGHKNEFLAEVTVELSKYFWESSFYDLVARPNYGFGFGWTHMLNFKYF